MKVNNGFEVTRPLNVIKDELLSNKGSFRRELKHMIEVSQKLHYYAFNVAQLFEERAPHGISFEMYIESEYLDILGDSECWDLVEDVEKILNSFNYESIALFNKIIDFAEYSDLMAEDVNLNDYNFIHYEHSPQQI